MPDRPPTSPQPARIWPPEALLGEEMLEATLDLVISLGTSILDGADGISVTLFSRTPGEFHTPSATSEEVREVDAVQYQTGQGPCVEASRRGEPVNVVIASEQCRWPEFAEEAAKRTMGSVLSVPLPIGERVIGALNVYSGRAHAFPERDERVIGQFARHAGAVLGHASEFMANNWVNENLAEALSRADVIGQAKGILIARGYSPDEAFRTLRRASERSNRKLSEVAQDLVVSSRRARPS